VKNLIGKIECSIIVCFCAAQQAISAAALAGLSHLDHALAAAFAAKVLRGGLRCHGYRADESWPSGLRSGARRNGNVVLWRFGYHDFHNERVAANTSRAGSVLRGCRNLPHSFGPDRWILRG